MDTHAMRAGETQIEQPGLKKTTFGTGLVKGLGITMRHLLSRAVTVQYPDEQDPLPARSRGVIALKEENCTVCMLCARECPDWCIYIDGHKETRAPAQEGKRAKKYNVLDRFAIDYALCMYCGICVEVCPYDALFWSPEFAYAEHDVTNLTHEMDRLADWMYTVLPPDSLDEGALGPDLKAAVGPSPASKTAAGPGRVPQESVGPGESPATPPAAQAAAPAGEDTPSAAAPGGPAAPPADAAAPAPTAPPTEAAEGEARATVPLEPEPQPEAATPVDAAVGPEAATPAEAVEGVSAEEAEEMGRRVYEEEIAKGSDPRVAEARRKAAVIRARKGTGGPRG